MASLEKMRQLRSDKELDTLIEAIRNNEFSGEDIHSFIVTELGMINYFTKIMSHDEDSPLLEIIGDNITLVVELIDNKNISNKTLSLICSGCLFEMLADYAYNELFLKII